MDFHFFDTVRKLRLRARTSILGENPDSASKILEFSSQSSGLDKIICARLIITTPGVVHHFARRVSDAPGVTTYEACVVHFTRCARRANHAPGAVLPYTLRPAS